MKGTDPKMWSRWRGLDFEYQYIMRQERPVPLKPVDLPCDEDYFALEVALLECCDDPDYNVPPKRVSSDPSHRSMPGHPAPKWSKAKLKNHHRNRVDFDALLEEFH
jgi:hypothetical protein